MTEFNEQPPLAPTGENMLPFDLATLPPPDPATRVEGLAPPGIDSTPISPDTEQADQGWRYRDTAKLALLSTIGIGAVGAVLSRVGIKTGNSNSRKILEQLTEKPVKSVLRGCITVPVLEEFTSRLAPSKVVDALDPHNPRSAAWRVGVATSAHFAALHGLKQDGERIYPIPQFLMGLVFWHLQRKRGFDHAVLAHAVVNAVPCSFALVALGAIKLAYKKTGDEMFNPQVLFRLGADKPDQVA